MLNLRTSAIALSLMTLLPLLSLSQTASSVSFERAITYIDAVNEADLVVVGKVGTIRSYRTRENMPASTVEMTDVSVLGDGLALPFNEIFELHVYGGVFPSENPESDKRYTLEYIEGAPAFNSGDELLILVKGNGSSVLPLVGTPHSVLTIDRLSNTITGESGSFLTAITEEGGLVFEKPTVLNVGDVELVYSIPDEPVASVGPDEITKPYEALDADVFLDLVADWRLRDIEADLQNIRSTETGLFAE